MGGIGNFGDYGRTTLRGYYTRTITALSIQILFCFIEILF